MNAAASAAVPVSTSISTTVTTASTEAGLNTNVALVQDAPLTTTATEDETIVHV